MAGRRYGTYRRPGGAAYPDAAGYGRAVSATPTTGTRRRERINRTRHEDDHVSANRLPIRLEPPHNGTKPTHLGQVGNVPCPASRRAAVRPERMLRSAHSLVGDRGVLP
ncbi:hypothetical protein KRM28CT15_62740 [Krasilnikovia sp. M28-CT-15]